MEEISKSKRKRDMLALQKIGEILVGLPANQLEKIPLDSTLAEAIAVARKLKDHEAKRRQLQYIGKLMRQIDPEPIQAAVATLQNKDRESKVQFHKLERWRDRLIAEGDDALQQFIEEFPDADRQYLRQLIRKAQHEKTKGVNLGGETELFRYLRSQIS